MNKFNGLLNYLVNDGLLSHSEAEAAAKSAEQQSISLTRYLIQTKRLNSETLLQCYSKNFGLPIFDLRNFRKIWLTNSTIKPELIFRYRVLPLNRDRNYLYLGIADPTNHAAIATIGFHTGLRIRPMLVNESDLNTLIGEHYKANAQTELQTSLSKITIDEPPAKVEQTKELEENEEPVIEFVDRLIKDAIEKQISDIHIEPLHDPCRIRFRGDGFLYETASLPKSLAARIITRLKIMANMNIAERRLPQDGRIHFNAHNKIDIRMNTCPTLFGEKIVLRLLDATIVNLDINHLGFSKDQKEIFLNHIKAPQGLILVTGPTGSGKTTTLYSALHYVNKIEKNIMSVEDPVEIELPGINQININPRIGLDFAAVLRAILRQDPDIIMIGEIRDVTTAEIAIQAAQTGHLVLSTLHTNSAIDTIIRLQAMGIPAYHLISSITLIIAQRLVRKICVHCAAKSIKGCNHCQHGYKGRIGIFEFIPMTGDIAKIISSGENANVILERIKSCGHAQLGDSVMEKIKLGITSDTEARRVLGDIHTVKH